MWHTSCSDSVVADEIFEMIRHKPPEPGGLREKYPKPKGRGVCHVVLVYLNETVDQLGS